MRVFSTALHLKSEKTMDKEINFLRLNMVPLLLAVALGLAGLAGCGKGGGDEAETAASGEAREQLMAALDRYEKEMAEIADQLREPEEGGSTDDGAVERSARQLVGTSEEIIRHDLAVTGNCSDYLNASLEVVGKMETISEEAIERDYHLDRNLPEGSPECYHVKDLLVHPATIIVLLREAGLEERRDDMLHEITENESHLSAVRSAL